MPALALTAYHVEPYRGSADPLMAEKRGLPMMRLIISVMAFVAVIAVTTTLLRSRSPALELSVATAAMPSLQALHTMVGVNTLANQDIEDQSLVYPTAEKR
jgi:uncharacterized membrane protein YfbV (UPF0208 family)